MYEFVTDSEREGFIAKLQETEDWLYEDGEDETKGVYISKLDELKKVCFLCTLYLFFVLIRFMVFTWHLTKFQQGDPIEQRYKEHSERGTFVDQLSDFVNWYKQAASGSPDYEHIDVNEKQKVTIW